MNKRYKIFTLLYLSSFFAISQTGYFPEAGNWKEKQVKEYSINPEKINKAINFAQENEYSGSKDLRQAILKSFEREPFHEIMGPTKQRGGPAGMILKDGYIIARWGDTKRVDMTFSVTKSFLSTTALLALDKGLISHVDEPVLNYVWDGTFKGEHNSKITWEHLLNQSSDWSGELWESYDWADRPPSEGALDDWRNRDLNIPGTVFNYNDVRVNLLAYSLLQVWRKPLPKVLKEQISTDALIFSY